MEQYYIPLTLISILGFCLSFLFIDLFFYNRYLRSLDWNSVIFLKDFGFKDKHDFINNKHKKTGISYSVIEYNGVVLGIKAWSIKGSYYITKYSNIEQFIDKIIYQQNKLKNDLRNLQ